MTPVVTTGKIGVGILADPMTAADLVMASTIWPGVFPYATALDRILTHQLPGLPLRTPRDLA